MKKNIFLLCYFCFSLSLLAQPTINGEWTETVNETFSELEKERVPTGILLDYAMEFADVAAYNGVLTDTTAINLRVFSNIYKTLFMGRVTTDTVFFPQMKTVAHNWALQRLEQNGEEQRTIVLGGLFYEYARIDPDALEENRITVTENGYADNYIESVWQNPYITQSTMAFAPPIQSYNRLEFDVFLPGELFLTNIPDATEAIEVDFGDGNGFQSLSFDEKLTVSYEENGTYQWVFRHTSAQDEVMYSTSLFKVAQPQVNEIEIVSLPGATLSIDYAPMHHGVLKKPFIVAEGFDPGHITSPEKPGGDKTLSPDFFRDLLTSGSLRNLLLQQYDIVYIDWKNGTDKLQNNSTVLEGVLDWVNSNKVGEAQNVLLGQSMGGVIGRYTLARMEQEGKNHDVRLFVSHDAPLQGANTPLSTQFFMRHFHNEYVKAPVAYHLGEVVLPIFMGLAELMSDLINSMGGNTTVNPYLSPNAVLTVQDTPAAVQMNYQWVSFDETVVTALHEHWQDQFEAMGYPEDSENIAISNGNECGSGHGFAPGDMLLKVQDTDNPDFWGDLVHMIGIPLVGLI